MTRLALLPFVPLLVPTLVAVPLAAQQAYTLAGDRVAIYNLAGKVSIEPGTGASVVVRATPGGADAGGLRFEQGAIKGRTAFRVVYPGDRIAYRALGRGNNTNLRVNDDGTFDGGWGKGGRRVEITGDRGTEAHADLAIAVPAGKIVEVHLAAGAMTATNVRGDLMLDASMADVTVSGHRGSLIVDAGSGNTEISSSEGDVTVDVGSGNVSLNDVATSDELSVDTGSGDVTGTRLRARGVRVDTGSGSVELSGVQAAVLRVDTGSGDVRVDLDGDAETIAIDTGSGEVALRLPAAFGAEVSVETGSGDVRTDVPLQVTRRGEDGLRGTLGDGRGRLVVETGSGDVSLLKR